MKLSELLAMSGGFKTLSICQNGDELWRGMRDDFESSKLKLYNKLSNQEVKYIYMVPTEEDTSGVELIVTLDPKMPRTQITDIVNKLAAESNSLDFPLKECWDLISGYCRENHKEPLENKYAIDNGCLFINDKLIKRLIPLPLVNPPVKGAFPNENEPDYEAVILSRQEAEVGGN